jgi:hypothetical protein
LKSVQIGLPVDPSGGNGLKIPVPATLNYDAWLGCTPEQDYSQDRVHPQSDDPKKLFGRPGWLRLNAYTCGMITGWGSHHLDIAHWAMGTEYSGPIAVEACAKWPGPDSFWDVHGSFDVKLHYRNGVVMRVSDELPNGIRFEGENGWIWVTRGPANSTKSIDASDPGLLTGRIDRKSILHRSPGWDHHLDWLEAIRDRKNDSTNAETGHRSCSACIVSWIGMKLGQPLKWDPEAEQFNDAAANRMLDRPERTPYGAFNAARRVGFTGFKSLRNVHA